MSLMGLDVGTTGCKAVAFDLEGRILASAYREYPLNFVQPGWAELDGNRVWHNIVSCLQKVCAETKKDPVTALAVSCQGEAVSPVDADGNILHNAIVSFDTRTEPYVQRWVEKFGRETIFQRTGQPLAALFTALKMQWIRDNKPEALKKAKSILGFEDLVMYKLGMPPTSDYTFSARTLFFDINRCDWDDEFLEFSGVDRSQMPTPKPSGTLVGTVPDSIADEIGLPRGLQVVTGGHDQPCQTLGAGVTEPNVAAYGIGTVECIAPAFTEPVLNDVMLSNNICCYHHTCPDLYIALIYNLTGGSLYKWYRDQFGQEEQRRADASGQDVYDILSQEAAKEPSKLLVLPHFTATGVPHFDTHSRGAIVGLTLETTKGEITRALLEGLTYELRMCVELLNKAGVNIDVLRATGGGAKSDYWLQIKADIMGIPIAVPQISEAGCLGCAILAGSATGKYASVREAAATISKIGKTFEPDDDNQRFYSEQYALYNELYPRLKDVFHKMP